CSSFLLARSHKSSRGWDLLGVDCGTWPQIRPATWRGLHRGTVRRLDCFAASHAGCDRKIYRSETGLRTHPRDWIRFGEQAEYVVPWRVAREFQSGWTMEKRIFARRA